MTAPCQAFGGAGTLTAAGSGGGAGSEAWKPAEGGDKNGGETSANNRIETLELTRCWTGSRI
jgi:hypothetical protein